MRAKNLALLITKVTKFKPNQDRAIAQTAQMLKEGKILAIKGIGGFHLAVDAFNNDGCKTSARTQKKRA